MQTRKVKVKDESERKKRCTKEKANWRRSSRVKRCQVHPSQLSTQLGAKVEKSSTSLLLRFVDNNHQI